jgi:hypothetical protein
VLADEVQEKLPTGPSLGITIARRKHSTLDFTCPAVALYGTDCPTLVAEADTYGAIAVRVRGFDQSGCHCFSPLRIMFTPSATWRIPKTEPRSRKGSIPTIVMMRGAARSAT